MGNSYMLELPCLSHGHQKLPCLKTSQWMTWHRCGATCRLADAHTHAIQYILLWLHIPANVFFHHWSWKQSWNVRTVCCWRWWLPQAPVGGRSTYNTAHMHY